MSSDVDAGEASEQSRARNLASAVSVRPVTSFFEVAPKLNHKLSEGLVAAVLQVASASNPAWQSLKERASLGEGAKAVSRHAAFSASDLLSAYFRGTPASSLLDAQIERVLEPLSSLVAAAILPTGSALAELYKQVIGDQSWFASLAESVRRGRLHLPPNWRGVVAGPGDSEDSVRQVLEEGIPLAWVPSARVIERLLQAPDAPSRRRIIADNHRGILSDCENVVGRLPHRRALFYVDMLHKAIGAVRDGHIEAGQALATNVLDTVCRHHMRDALDMSFGGAKNVSTYERHRKKGWRIVLAVHSLSTVMSGSYKPADRPTGYRRNATSHTITRHQYNRINAVLAIMNATAVLTCFARDTPAFD
ncbi:MULTISPECIES: hypothetical protein [Bacteria]|uniref:hypothetical protein n=1 Tax=Bacteria TaxID=2 RepID=UPI0018CDCA1D|nr:hypothetical protein [Bacillus toyonensis]